MNSLIASNLTHHKGRTLASVIGVAVGVFLVVMTVGLVRGALRDRGQRDSQIGVEIMVSGQGQGLGMGAADMNLPATMADDIRSIEGVKAVAAVGQNLELKGDKGVGLRQIDGIRFDEFTAATNLRLIKGDKLPSEGDFAILDTKMSTEKKLKPGDKVSGLDREFTITGIYEPESGARIKVPLKTMQEALGAESKCSMIFVRCANSEEQEIVAKRIIDKFPDSKILFTRDLPELYATGYSGFNVFLNVVAVLAAVISVLVILLTMYTTVTERTRQIGILKSLGASKTFIAGVFVKEALLIALLGVATGLLASLAARFFLVRFQDWKIDIEPDYVAYAAIAGLLSGAIGALYPAMRAARQDPIDALSYE
jgi:putative ABC transport system permease protein